MDNKRIIFTNADGNMSVIVPAPGCTEEQALKAVPAGLPYEIVNAEDVPADRTFRNAWQHDTTPAPQKVAIDMVKAKDSTHEKRRALRSTEFAPLDVEATIPSKAASAEAKRQTVRDKHDRIQVDINTASTPDQLKAIIVTEGL